MTFSQPSSPLFFTCNYNNTHTNYIFFSPGQLMISGLCYGPPKLESFQNFQRWTIRLKQIHIDKGMTADYSTNIPQWRMLLSNALPDISISRDVSTNFQKSLDKPPILNNQSHLPDHAEEIQDPQPILEMEGGTSHQLGNLELERITNATVPLWNQLRSEWWSCGWGSWLWQTSGQWKWGLKWCLV